MPTRHTHLDQKHAPAGRSGAFAAPKIGVSITNERGERYHGRACAVSLHIKRGVIQIVDREPGCFVWFERCNLEVRDGRRNVQFRLLAGLASSDGTDLTIVAEVAHQPGATAGNRSPGNPSRALRAGKKTNAPRNGPPTKAVA